jgi:hypothetical protein
MSAVFLRTPPDLPISWNRRFQTWRYEVGHRCLALRSPRPEYATNIDVQFHNVGLMLLSPMYASLTLRSPTPSELQTIEKLWPSVAESAEVVVIGANDMEGFVCCAGGWWVEESDKDYSDPPQIFTLPET